MCSFEPARIQFLDIQDVIDDPHQARCSDASSPSHPLFQVVSRAPRLDQSQGPRMEVSGVLSSWLTVEMNSRFICSIWRRWVMFSSCEMKYNGVPA